MSKQGIRIIPKGKDPSSQLASMAIDRGWHLKKAVARNPETGTDGEFVFHLADLETWVSLRDDLFVGFMFFSILGPEKEVVATEIRKEFDHWTEAELFAWWDRALETGNVDDKVDAVLFLGVNTQETPNSEYTPRIKAALLDEDKDVRNAAVAAAGYSNWRVFRDDLERIAASDLDEKARARACFILDGWKVEDESSP